MIVLLTSASLTPGVISTIVGTIGAVVQANGLRMAFASRKWTALPGHIRSAGIHGNALAWRDNDIPSVRYTYDIGGHTHVGWRIRFGMPQSGIGGWEDVGTLNQFRDVTVYYDPLDRDQSVLEPGTTAAQWLGMALSLGLLGLGIWLVAR